MDSANDHLRFSSHLTAAPFDERFRATFLGQAHLAGTGPDNATCRECKFWHVWRGTASTRQPAPPGHYAKTNKERAGQLKRANCNYAIPHKAKRRIPHHAKACRFFERSDNPPALVADK